MAKAIKKKTSKKPMTYDIIRVEAKRDPSETNDVYVAVGAKNFILQREQLIPIPTSVTGVLRDAVIERRVEGVHDEGRAKMQRITRFPFSVLYTNIGDAVYGELREIALVRSLTQADVDKAMSPETDEAPVELQT